jgi:hypothetical protein
MNSVSSNKHIASEADLCFTIATVGKVSRYSARRFLETCEVMARNYTSLSKPVLHRLQQKHLQLTAMDADLRPMVTGSNTARFAPDFLSFAGDVDKVFGLDSGAQQSVKETKFIQKLNRVGQYLDANAEWFDLDCRLQHNGFDAQTM